MELKPLFNRGLARYQYYLLVGVFLALVCNNSFYAQHAGVYAWQDYPFFNASVVLLNLFLTLFLLALFNLILPFRLLAISFLLIGASGSYFADSYGVVIDTGMLTNAIQTNTSEALDLMNWGMFWHFLLIGVLPALFVAKVPLRRIGRKHSLMQIALILVTLPLLMVGMIVSSSDSYANFFRQHKHIRYYANPLYPLYSSVKLVTDELDQGTVPDYVSVTSKASASPYSKPRLTIVVVGETVRADHVSLNGYQKQTMPEMAAQENVVNFSDVSACGTSTAVSVPCMFSLYDRADFELDEASYTENTLDVLSKAGVQIQWRDNNSSSKGVADRLSFVDYRTDAINPYCDTECRDVGMLAGADQWLASLPSGSDALLVLHQMGNHGPAYFKRYPPEFNRFTPACQTAELSQCSLEEISNAYDNALLYTDYFLAQVVAYLKSRAADYAVSMLYVSDHGESLGENGLFLHGMPYSFAPETQIKVPVLLWADDDSQVDIAATRAGSSKALSHDNVASSLLTLFGVTPEFLSSHQMAAPLVTLKASGESGE